MTRRRAAAALATLAVVAAAAGCTSARNTLGTNSSPCFSALPAARQAVHDRGTFSGVLLVRSSAFDQRTTPRSERLRAELTRRAGHPLSNVCVVAYSGDFSSGDVQDPFPSSSTTPGRYAVVVLAYPGDKLLGTAVRTREPLRFLHWRVGG